MEYFSSAASPHHQQSTPPLVHYPALFLTSRHTVQAGSRTLCIGLTLPCLQQSSCCISLWPGTPKTPHCPHWPPCISGIFWMYNVSFPSEPPQGHWSVLFPVFFPLFFFLICYPVVQWFFLFPQVSKVLHLFSVYALWELFWSILDLIVRRCDLYVLLTYHLDSTPLKCWSRFL